MFIYCACFMLLYLCNIKDFFSNVNGRWLLEYCTSVLTDLGLLSSGQQDWDSVSQPAASEEVWALCTLCLQDNLGFQIPLGILASVLSLATSLDGIMLLTGGKVLGKRCSSQGKICPSLAETTAVHRSCGIPWGPCSSSNASLLRQSWN